MELHYGHMSGNSSRAVFGLLESGARFTPRFVDTKAGENRTSAYLALNPMGKIPTLTEGAFRLWESNAINWYVAEKHPDARLLPTSAEARASVQRWLYFQTGHVTPACVALFRVINKRVQAFWSTPGTQPDEKAAEAARRELGRFLPVLETALEGREWLEGVFALADIAYVPHFVMLAEGGFDFAPYPRLKAWFERTCARPAWKEAYALVFGEGTPG
jgi:glutathione S-transferase